MKIVFYGTPEFAVPSLAILLDKGYTVSAVVTAPDKPAGRGLKLTPSSVKVFAESRGIPVLQPVKLGDEEFLTQLRAIQPDLQIVVAFRKMPESVWGLPRLGTFNLHGSLLPQYRGAAPIHRAVMNGESQTGVTTFFLQQEIDTGNILFNDKFPIGPDENTGSVHDRMMLIGAALVLKTVQAIEQGNAIATDQAMFMQDETVLHPAPKIKKEDCRIDWYKSTQHIHNHIRGLSPHPAAFTHLVGPDGKTQLLKIYQATMAVKIEGALPGSIICNGSDTWLIATADGSIRLLEVQLEGKKRMPIDALLRGFRLNADHRVE